MTKEERVEVTIFGTVLVSLPAVAIVALALMA